LPPLRLMTDESHDDDSATGYSQKDKQQRPSILWYDQDWSKPEMIWLEFWSCGEGEEERLKRFQLDWAKEELTKLSFARWVPRCRLVIFTQLGVLNFLDCWAMQYWALYHVTQSIPRLLDCCAYWSSTCSWSSLSGILKVSLSLWIKFKSEYLGWVFISVESTIWEHLRCLESTI
jgi:hypothetical protein